MCEAHSAKCESFCLLWGAGWHPPRKFLKIWCFKFEAGGNFSHTMVIIIAENVHWKINTIIMYIKRFATKFDTY